MTDIWLRRETEDHDWEVAASGEGLLEGPLAFPTRVPEGVPVEWAGLLLGYASAVASGFGVHGGQPSMDAVRGAAEQLLSTAELPLSGDEAMDVARLLRLCWEGRKPWESIEGDFRALGLGMAARLESWALAHAGRGGTLHATLADALLTLWALDPDAVQDELCDEAAAEYIEVRDGRQWLLPRVRMTLSALGCPDGDEPDAPPEMDAVAASPFCYLR